MIMEAQKPQVIFLLACINQASKTASPLSNADVTGRANLNALLAQIKTRETNIANDETSQIIFRYLRNNLKGLKDQFGDAVVAAFTTVKGTAAGTDLRYYVWSLLDDANFDINYSAVTEGAFVLAE